MKAELLQIVSFGKGTINLDDQWVVTIAIAAESGCQTARVKRFTPFTTEMNHVEDSAV